MTEWARRAGAGNCVGTDSATWFSTDPVDVQRCQRICSDCPLRVGCLAGAWLRDEQWGIWGGVQFSPRVTSCWTEKKQGRWLVRGVNVFGVETHLGAHATRDEARKRAAAVLEESSQRWSVSESLRASRDTRFDKRAQPRSAA